MAEENTNGHNSEINIVDDTEEVIGWGAGGTIPEALHGGFLQADAEYKSLAKLMMEYSDDLHSSAIRTNIPEKQVIDDVRAVVEHYWQTKGYIDIGEVLKFEYNLRPAVNGKRTHDMLQAHTGVLAPAGENFVNRIRKRKQRQQGDG